MEEPVGLFWRIFSLGTLFIPAVIWYYFRNNKAVLYIIAIAIAVSVKVPIENAFLQVLRMAYFFLFFLRAFTLPRPNKK